MSKVLIFQTSIARAEEVMSLYHKLSLPFALQGIQRKHASPALPLSAPKVLQTLVARYLIQGMGLKILTAGSLPAILHSSTLFEDAGQKICSEEGKFPMGYRNIKCTFTEKVFILTSCLLPHYLQGFCVKNSDNIFAKLFC